MPMSGGWSESNFSLFKSEFTDKQKGGMVTDENGRHQNELKFGLIQIQMVSYRNIYRYVYIQLVNTHFSLSCQLRGPKNSEIPITMNITSTQILVCSIFLFFSIRNHQLLHKQLIIGLGEGIHKISLQYLIEPQSKEILRQNI